MAASDNHGLTYDVVIVGSGIAGALVAYKIGEGQRCSPVASPSVGGSPPY